MVCIAQQGFACECGSLKLASCPAESGFAFLCTQCARAYLGPNAPVTWAQLMAEISTRPSDVYCFEWVRGNIPWDDRRTLQPAPLRRSANGRALLALTLVLVLALTACRAVFS